MVDPVKRLVSCLSVFNAQIFLGKITQTAAPEPPDQDVEGVFINDQVKR